MIELTISIKTSESTYKHKFLVYEPVVMSEECPTIALCLKQAQKALNSP